MALSFGCLGWCRNRGDSLSLLRTPAAHAGRRGTVSSASPKTPCAPPANSRLRALQAVRAGGPGAAARGLASVGARPRFARRASWRRLAALGRGGSGVLARNQSRETSLCLGELVVSGWSAILLTSLAAKSAVELGVTPLLTWESGTLTPPARGGPSPYDRRPLRRSSANWVCSTRALSQAAPGRSGTPGGNTGKTLKDRHLGFPPVARTRSLPVECWTADASVMKSLGA